MKYLALLFGIFVFASIPFSCSKFEQPHRYFENYTASIHQDNWVPDIFPKDITKIHEQHDIDTNEVWLSYTPGQHPFNPTKLGMVALSESEIEKTKFRAPFWASWWFEGPVQQQPANDGALNAVIYRGVNKSGVISYFTCDVEKNKCYWWQK
jgi:hypothetical protein